MKLLLLTAYCFLFTAAAWAGQPTDINVPLGVPTPVTLSPGTVETLPVAVPAGHKLASMRLDRATFTDPSIGVVIQVWSLIGGTWTQTAVGRTSGSGKEPFSGTSGEIRGGTQVKARFVTAGKPFNTTVVFQTK